MWRFDYNYREPEKRGALGQAAPQRVHKGAVKFSTQPMEYLEDPDDLYRMFEMIGSEDFLMFATDYPDSDSILLEQALPRNFPKELQAEDPRQRTPRSSMASNDVECHGLCTRPAEGSAHVLCTAGRDPARDRRGFRTGTAGSRCPPRRQARSAPWRTLARTRRRGSRWAAIERMWVSDTPGTTPTGRSGRNVLALSLARLRVRPGDRRRPFVPGRPDLKLETYMWRSRTAKWSSYL